MNVTHDLKDARLTVSATAVLARMHPAHFRRLVRQGVFPKPRKTAGGRSYFNHELLVRIAEILKRGIGENGREVMFYRKSASVPGSSRPRQRSRKRPPPDAYLKSLTVALKQLGLSREDVNLEKVKAALAAEFGEARPDLHTAIPAICRRVLDKE
jgi:DNA-binding transcriptional MerR regulator